MFKYLLLILGTSLGVNAAVEYGNLTVKGDTAHQGTMTNTGASTFNGVSTFNNTASLANQKEFRFYEATGGGTNYISLKAPSALANDYNLVLPLTVGFAGQALINDGTGVLSWGEAGGGGELNFISNDDAEIDTSGWVTYADAASSKPVDGTGGSPVVTWTRSTSNPLSGIASFVITKDANNRQGNGVSNDFTIDTANKAKVLKIEADYIVNSGTFVAGSNSTDSDLIVYLYDVTNNLLIEPSNFKFYSNSTAISDKFQATFQTVYNSTSYRLIVHCASTSASAYTVKFDNIKISPSRYVYGTPVSDFINYGTITIGAVTTAPTKGTNSTDQVQVSRMGDSGRFLYNYSQTAAGSAGSGDYLFSLPSGMSFDSGKVKFYTGALTSTALISTYGMGIAHVQYANTSSSPTNASLAFGKIIPYDSTRFRVHIGYIQTTGGSAQSSGTISNVMSDLSAPVMIYSFDFTAPIAGWTSNVRVSDGYDGRILSNTRLKDASQSISAVAETPITFNKTQRDTANMADVANNGVRIVSSGDYSASLVLSASNLTVGERLIIRIKKNGSDLVSVNGLEGQGANTAFGNTGINSINLTAGDLLTATVESNADTSYNVVYATLTVAKNQSPQTIASDEEVSANLYMTNNQWINFNNLTNLNFDSVYWDTHGSWDTVNKLFRAPVSGRYEFIVKTHLTANSGGSPASVVSALSYYKNGVLADTIPDQDVGAASKNGNYGNSKTATRIWQVQLLAGDTIYFRVNHYANYSSGNVSADAQYSSVTMKKLK